jgi:glycerophosphoryl diester phosphodiesterase
MVGDGSFSHPEPAIPGYEHESISECGPLNKVTGSPPTLSNCGQLQSSKTLLNMRTITIAFVAGALAFALASAIPLSSHTRDRDDRDPGIHVELGPRPYFLIDDMDDGPLKKKLQSCSAGPFHSSSFSIGHRGSSLQFPEETMQAMLGGARMGAGILECDVIFTKDRQLVCRHSQCDLHTTTNILTIPELAAKCTKPFTPAAGIKPADANCCTSDIKLSEFKKLCGKMDGFNASATTAADFQNGTPSWRTDLYAACGKVMTHKEYISLVDSLGLQFTPELKTPVVKMPYQGDYTQEKYAQQMIDEYKAARINPQRVWAQSFLPDDIFYWLKAEPAFGEQAVYLDERVDTPDGYKQAVASLPDLAKKGVKIMGPPIPALLTLDAQKRIVPSDYATIAKAAGLGIITWTLERSGPLAAAAKTMDYYYASIAPAIKKDGDMYTVLDVLAQQVKILGIFSDWSATVTYYANCFNLK